VPAAVLAISGKAVDHFVVLLLEEAGPELDD
jgi:hypothetical protein